MGGKSGVRGLHMKMQQQVPPLIAVLTCMHLLHLHSKISVKHPPTTCLFMGTFVRATICVHWEQWPPMQQNNCIHKVAKQACGGKVSLTSTSLGMYCWMAPAFSTSVLMRSSCFCSDMHVPVPQYQICVFLYLSNFTLMSKRQVVYCVSYACQALCRDA